MTGGSQTEVLFFIFDENYNLFLVLTKFQSYTFLLPCMQDGHVPCSRTADANGDPIPGWLHVQQLQSAAQTPTDGLSEDSHQTHGPV